MLVHEMGNKPFMQAQEIANVLLMPYLKRLPLDDAEKIPERFKYWSDIINEVRKNQAL